MTYAKNSEFAAITPNLRSRDKLIFCYKFGHQRRHYP